MLSKKKQPELYDLKAYVQSPSITAQKDGTDQLIDQPVDTWGHRRLSEWNYNVAASISRIIIGGYRISNQPTFVRCYRSIFSDTFLFL